MRTSTMTARVITAIIALVMTPIALGLIATGGVQWMHLYIRLATQTLTPQLLISLGALGAGLVLLVAVVLTGLWSSAGLITAGILSIFPLVTAIFPGLTSGLHSTFHRVLPREWLDGLSFGLPLVILPALGGLGIALMQMRRHPRHAPIWARVVGLVGIPIALLAGGWATQYGLAVSYRELLFNADSATVTPIGALAVLVGTAIVVAAAIAVRWSPYALFLPAAALLMLSMMATAPGSTMWMRQALGGEVWRTLQTLLMVGGGVAVALIFITFTIVAASVRRRSMRTLDAAWNGGMPTWMPGTDSTPIPTYPNAQYPNAQSYPPAPQPPAPPMLFPPPT